MNSHAAYSGAKPNRRMKYYWCVCVLACCMRLNEQTIIEEHNDLHQTYKWNQLSNCMHTNQIIILLKYLLCAMRLHAKWWNDEANRDRMIFNHEWNLVSWNAIHRRNCVSLIYLIWFLNTHTQQTVSVPCNRNQDGFSAVNVSLIVWLVSFSKKKCQFQCI